MNSHFLVRKIMACLMAGITLFSTILLVGRDINLPWVSPQMVFSLAGLALIGGLIFPFIWHIRKLDFTSTFNAILAIIAYGVAFSISIFGWKKIFKLQFRLPLSVADEPFSNLSGEWLTWGYFGYSYPFTLVVAFLQIGGAVLLLFRQTRLFGVFILLPIMLNILLINAFYHLNTGALLQSIIITMGLLYLLSLHYQRLVTFFFHQLENLPRAHFSGRKGLIMLLTVGVPFVVIYLESQKKENAFMGKYEVQQGNIASLQAGMALTKVYFDLGDVLVLEYGNSTHRTIAPYIYDRETHTLKATFNQNSKQDSLTATLKQTDNQLNMSGKFNERKFDIALKKIN